jgi:hypothetical protein
LPQHLAQQVGVLVQVLRVVAEVAEEVVARWAVVELV